MLQNSVRKLSIVLPREEDGRVEWLGANVISVHHERASETKDINGCYLRMVLETRNYEHIESISRALADAGFKIISY